jgi:hypothetical protein
MLGVKAWPSSRHLVMRANVLLSGAYAWATTVAHPASQRGAGTGAAMTAGAALVALLVASAVLVGHPRVGRAFGILGFVVFCLVTWVLLDSLIDVRNLDPVRACFGALGWALFALGWGSTEALRAAATQSEEVERESPLVPRGRLPRGAPIVLAIGFMGAVSPLLLAWQENRPERALLAHGVALVCAIVIVTVAAGIALDRGKHAQLAPARVRLRAAMSPLSALAFALAAGFVWVLLSY